MENRVAIIGLGPSNKDAPDWERWGLPWDPLFPQYDLGFEMHDRKLWGKDGPYRHLMPDKFPNYLDRLKSSYVPVFMREHQPDITMSVRYPFTDVSDDLDIADYYGSSVAYMLALAIHREYGEIGLWGVDLSEDVYDHQRPNLEHLLGIGKARGINFVIPEGSKLLSLPNGPYGAA